MASDNKRMKAFSKRLGEMRKTPSAAISKAEDDTAPKLSSVETPKQKVKADLGNSSFASAFRAARSSGDKTFTWKGKSFTTKMAGEGGTKPAAKPASAPVKASGISRADAMANKGDYGFKKYGPQGLGDLRDGSPPKAETKPKPAASVKAVAAPKSLSVERGKYEGDGKKGLGVPKSLAAHRGKYEGDGKKGLGAPKSLRADPYGFYSKAKGGSVKKFNKGGSTSDPRRAVLGSDKDIIGRGNRTPYEPIPKTGPDKPKSKPLGRAGKAGFKSGGSVMKKGIDGVAKKGHTKGMEPKMACGGKMKGYAKGGSIDGIAKKGKTRCKGAK